MPPIYVNSIENAAYRISREQTMSKGEVDEKPSIIDYKDFESNDERKMGEFF